MAQHRMWMAVLTANAIWMAVICLGFLATVLWGGQIETSLAPVVVFGETNEVYRDEIKVCWTLHIHKLRAGVPLKYEFFAETKLSALIPLSSYLANGDNSRKADSDLETHPVDARWERRYCSEIPQTIGDAQEMRISGNALHRRKIWGYNAWWNTVSRVPSFRVPAMGASLEVK